MAEKDELYSAVRSCWSAVQGLYDKVNTRALSGSRAVAAPMP